MKLWKCKKILLLLIYIYLCPCKRILLLQHLISRLHVTISIRLQGEGNTVQLLCICSFAEDPPLLHSVSSIIYSCINTDCWEWRASATQAHLGRPRQVDSGIVDRKLISSHKFSWTGIIRNCIYKIKLSLQAPYWLIRFSGFQIVLTKVSIVCNDEYGCPDKWREIKKLQEFKASCMDDETLTKPAAKCPTTKV